MGFVAGILVGAVGVVLLEAVALLTLFMLFVKQAPKDL